MQKNKPMGVRTFLEGLAEKLGRKKEDVNKYVEKKVFLEQILE